MQMHYLEVGPDFSVLGCLGDTTMPNFYRQIVIATGNSFSTKTIKYNQGYVLEITNYNSGTGNMSVTIRDLDTAGNEQRSALFRGDSKIVNKSTAPGNTRLVAVVRDISYTDSNGTTSTPGFTSFRLVIRSHEMSAFKDKIWMSKDPGNLLDAIKTVFDKDSLTMVTPVDLRHMTGGMSDPDAESFVRQGTPSAPNTDGTNGTNRTLPYPSTAGAILPNSVVVRVASSGALYAYDDGAGNLIDVTNTANTVGAVIYTPNWYATITVGGNTTIYTVEALRTI